MTQRLAGKVVRAHGIRGEVAVEVLTVLADERFAVGARLVEVDGTRGFRVESVRQHQGRLLVKFAEIPDRSAAEAITGIYVAGEEELGPPEGEVWPEDLEGARVVLVDGTDVGVVSEVLENPAHDLLAVALADGREVLVPFVEAIVREVDRDGGRLVIDPPAGLLDD